MVECGDGQHRTGDSRDARKVEKAVTRPAMQRAIKTNTWEQSCERFPEPSLERGKKEKEGGSRIGEDEACGVERRGAR